MRNTVLGWASGWLLLARWVVGLCDVTYLPGSTQLNVDDYTPSTITTHHISYQTSAIDDNQLP